MSIKVYRYNLRVFFAYKMLEEIYLSLTLSLLFAIFFKKMQIWGSFPSSERKQSTLGRIFGGIYRIDHGVTQSLVNVLNGTQGGCVFNL